MIYKLKPILKHRLWGGNALPTIFGVETNDKIGEAWILSCLKDDNSSIDDATTLADLFRKNPNIVAQNYQGQFPLLIKLIDAHDDLSIQVHPRIKTEFWHVLNPTPSKLHFGFSHDTTKEDVEIALKDGTLPKLLNNVTAQAGDSFLIKPGTIHAIGKGTFLIEIQQSADITYRLYDYDRLDTNGLPRELHIDQALYCIDYHQTRVFKNLSYEQLMSTPYFNVFKYNVYDTKQLEATEKSFHAIVILEGQATIKQDGQTLELNQYETCFIPAGSGPYEIVGDASVIVVTL